MTGPVEASWYYDAGDTACGFHAAYGFANKYLPCGTKVLMKGPNGASVVGTVEDRGPYVEPRVFDLNPAMRDALGCDGVCDVIYRVL